jgi:microcystin-dependent protein
MKKLLALLFCLFASPAAAGVSCTLPFQLTNGTLADATQVMANYNALTACLLNAAQAGANTDITSLAGLTTPISLNQGGTIVYTGGTSSGSANSQSITTTSPTFFYQTGAIVTFIAGFTNSGPLQVNVQGLGLKNVFRRSQLGATMSVGGEVIVGQTVQLQWDGSEFQCVSCGIYFIGEVKTVLAAAVPVGWLALDGSCQLQSTYTDLYNVVGNAPGGSCSSGSFALADGRGNVLAGLDTQGSNGNANRLSTYCTSGTLGEICGAQSQALSSTNQLPLFAPSGTVASTASTNFAYGNIVSATSADYLYAVSNAQFKNTGDPAGLAITSAFTGVAIGSASPSAFETVQPTLMVYTAVKY